MTQREAISRADALRPNAVSEEDKILWLRRLDGLLRREVIDRHLPAPGEAADRPGADTAADSGGALLAGEPDGGLYLYWLAAQIDLAEGELTRYVNDMQLYNAAYTEFAARYKAAHRPLPRGQFRL